MMVLLEGRAVLLRVEVGLLVREMRRKSLQLEDLVLEALDHRVAADLFLHEFLVQDLVDRVKTLVELVDGALDLALDLRSNLGGHDLPELGLNDFPDLVSSYVSPLGALIIATFSWLAQPHDLLLNLRQQTLPELLLQHFLLFLQQRLNSLFDLLLDHLGHRLLDGFSDSLLDGHL